VICGFVTKAEPYNNMCTITICSHVGIESRKVTYCDILINNKYCSLSWLGSVIIQLPIEICHIRLYMEYICGYIIRKSI